ncbi:MAG: proliferating cell nuclear antigen (pcna) [Candidatus Methanofastidiosia archaeon]
MSGGTSMIEVSISDSKVMKYIFESIAEVVDEATFKIDSEGLRIEGADPSIISKVEVYLKRDYFESFNVNGPAEFGVDMTSIDKVAKRIQSEDNIVIIYGDEENLMKMILNGGIERKFDVSLIELNNNLPKIEINFPAFVEMETEVFKNCVKDLAAVGSSVKFEIENGKMIMSSAGELGNSVVTINHLNPVIKKMEVKKSCVARYNLPYLMSFLKAGHISDAIGVSLGDRDFPIKLEFRLEFGYIIFYLAPMEI